MVTVLRVRLALGAVLLACAAQPVKAAGCADRLRWSTGSPADPHPLRAEDLIELRDFGAADSLSSQKGDFALSPDGTQIAVLLRRAEVASNSYCYGLAIIALATGAVRFADIGGEPILWTIDFRGQADQPFGAIDTKAPLWSADGRWIAFLRRDGGRTRLWRVASAGGAAKPFPTPDLDVRRFAWTADGGGLVYEIRPRLDAARAEIAREGRSGYLYDTRFAPQFASAPSPAPETPTDFRYAARDGDVDRAASDDEKDALLLPSRPGLPRGASVPVVASDGSEAWTGPRDADTYIGAAPITIRRAGRILSCGVAACADRIRGMWWLRPGELLFVRDWGAEALGAMELFRWRIGAKPVSLLRTTDPLLNCQFAAGALYCAHETSSRPRHIVRVDLRSGALHTIFDPNPEFPATSLGSVKRLGLRSADGAPAYADLVLPPDHRPGQRHPMVVVQYQTRGFLRGGVGDEYPVWLLAARGYAVLSYQRPTSVADDHKAPDLNAFQRINTQGFADRRRVFTALEQGVDKAIADGAVDPGRLGITGLSEGAASALWAMLATSRYRAAAVSTCCEDPGSVLYAGGLALARDVKAWGYPTLDRDTQGFWQTNSLALNARRITTPLLLQLSDQEYRLALQGFGALKDAGKPVELYVFPGEFHNKWQPAHRAAIYERAIDWFDFWLRDRVDPSAAKVAQAQRWAAMRDAASRAAHGLEPGLDGDQAEHPGR
ncbi:Atxe2 family lasso peptide isopeptidase [Sphingomonas sp. KR3-1]|uniref:Atxe2 family lasso peptide isopeptidase n=1 Tax=Sphingomonas sp. KR3-1 TaxID=3156611 RepID=UPI0032B3AC4C